jgi:membrane-bound lytic murein transglycosylase D
VASAAAEPAASAPPAPDAAATAASAAALVRRAASPEIAVAAAQASAASASALRQPRPARIRLDPEDDASHGDLWARVREGFVMPTLDNDLVRKWEQYYAQRPDYVQRMTARGSRYLYHIVEELDRRQMPLDLALLPFIESAFDPHARSWAKAAGMWQFMPGTARDFELKQNLFRDDRRDVLASTRAALDYLQSLNEMFGDWHLALAAYNWGQGNVQRAIARNTRRGRGMDYTSLDMPDETRNYVPKLQAIKNIVAQPERFGLELPLLENHPYFITVSIERDIDVALVAQLSGLSLEQFQQLNPQLNKPVILAAGTPQVLLPYDNANKFVAGLSTHDGPTASWTAWVAPRTLKPAEAARRVGMAEALLREVNLIPPRMLVKAGSTLLVPRSAQHTKDVSEGIADSAMMALTPEARAGRQIRIRVRRKTETVTSVANRYGLSAAFVAALNGVSISTTFKRGQLVKVLVPKKAARSSRSSSSKASKRKLARSGSSKASRAAPSRRPSR